MTRLVYSAGVGGRTTIPDILQSIFACELLAPSRTLWMTSPWISDVRLLDNRTDEFRGLSRHWSPGWVHLCQVLALIGARGSEIKIMTRPDAHGQAFVERLHEAVEREMSSAQIQVKMSNTLHEKGILTDTAYLSGSMNFTHKGIFSNDEHLRLDVDPGVLSEAALAFRQRWTTNQQSHPSFS